MFFQGGFAGAEHELASSRAEDPAHPAAEPRLVPRHLPRVGQQTIMLDDLDREAWFKLFVQVAHRVRWKVHAWCLLDNHFHLLVETTQPDLSAGMQRLNGVYAMRFNRRYNRAGHLFQGRFESRVIKTEEYPRR